MFLKSIIRLFSSCIVRCFLFQQRDKVSQIPQHLFFNRILDLSKVTPKRMIAMNFLFVPELRMRLTPVPAPEMKIRPAPPPNI